MSEIQKLKAQNAELSDRIAKLEEAAKPPKPFVPEPHQPIDHTAGFTAARMFDRETLQRMAAADDPSGRMADLRAYQQQRSVAASPAPEPQRPRGTGWVEPGPLEPPPGIALADRIVDAQDKLDLIDRANEFAKVAEVEAAKKEGEE